MANARRKCFLAALFRLPLRHLEMERYITHLAALSECSANFLEIAVVLMSG